VAHMTRLVDDLLDVSRITRDKIELRKQRVELAEVLRSAVETSRPLIDAGNHDLSITLPPQPIFVEADATRLAQVFSNLLNNSAKYTPRGGRIQVEVTGTSDEVAITVRDNGMGIECDELAFVFDMFRQVDRSLERSQGGLGIGLTLVRRLVQLHGGSVTAHSEGTGKGCEFVVRLPRCESKSNAEEAPTTVQESRKNRILVVDDNADSSSTLSRLLQIKVHDVRTPQDGIAAVAAASEFQPQVILMDVGMPRMNGYEATRRIREMPGGQEIVIVALTGWGQADDLRKATDAGCTAHLVKPVDLATLERLLARQFGSNP
jgi:CheY-like chemotaxis protein/two-component sensor histidine kinase